MFTDLSVEQAVLLAGIGGLGMGVWSRWMTKGEEWPVTALVRKHWQRLAKRVKVRFY